jgi:ATP-binding cassette, subfamily B, bacterial
MGIYGRFIKLVWVIFREYLTRLFSKEHMWAPFLNLLPYILRCKWSYVGLIIATLCNVAVSLLVARFLQLFADAAVHQELHKIGKMLPLGIGIIVFGCVVTFFMAYFRDVVVNRIETAVQNDLYQHMLKVKFKHLDNYKTGDIITRLTYDIRQIGQASGLQIIHLGQLVLTAVGALIYLLLINWKMTLVSVAMVPPAVCAMMVISKLVRINSMQIAEETSQLQSLLHESFGGLTVIRTFTLEDRFIKKFTAATGKILTFQIKNSKLRSSVSVGANLIHFISFLLSFTIGAYYIAHGQITVGGLLAFMTLMQHVVGPMLAAPKELGNYQVAMASTTRIWNLMNEKVEVMSALSKNVSPISEFAQIEYKEVSFSYLDGFPIINKLSATISPGRVVALVGASGAGKSTLFKLLLGLYRPNEGEISINGVSIKHMTPKELRQMIAYVPQETFLFNGTIRENIRYGRPEATDEQIIQAAKDAHAHEFIQSLPKGYDTEVGERAVRLSGGQRQRLAIARALLKDAPILLLDEATSSLDAESEKQVQNALNRLMDGRTTLIIAHRLSTVLNSDYVYVIDKGQVIEEGTHDQLLDQKPHYTKLYRLQFRTNGKKKIVQL